MRQAMAVCAERSVNTRICAELVLKIRISVSASTSVEERIDDLITRKMSLADEIVGTGEGWLTEMTTDDLRDLLMLRREAVDE